jgi:hypothetical protein
MASGIYVRANIEGIDKLLGKVASGPAFYADIWNSAIKQATDETFEAERKAAGKFPGTKMASSLTLKMDSRPVAQWGIVSLDAASSHGPDKKRGGPFRYPWALNASDRYHYRGTQRSTKGWWDRPLAQMRKRLQVILDTAAERLGAKWSA